MRVKEISFKEKNNPKFRTTVYVNVSVCFKFVIPSKEREAYTILYTLHNINLFLFSKFIKLMSKTLLIKLNKNLRRNYVYFNMSFS